MSAAAREIVSTAVLVVVIGSIMNARARGRRIMPGGLHRTQIPPPLSAATRALPSSAAAALRATEIEALEACGDMLIEARVRTLDGLLEPGAVLETQVAAAWCKVAAVMVQALDGLCAALERHDYPPPSFRRASLKHFLTAVSAGRSPCVSNRNEVIVPGWIERRRLRRFQMLRPVHVVRNSVRQRAATIDISRQGIGLIGVPAAVVGEGIAVEVSPDLVLEGLIVWTKDDRCGVRLTSPIDDALWGVADDDGVEP